MIEAKSRYRSDVCVTPEMIDAGVEFLRVEFFPCEWGGSNAISPSEAKALVLGVLAAMGLPAAHEQP